MERQIIPLRTEKLDDAIETLFPGDPRVRVLLGDQAKPEQTQRLRPCVYTAFHYTDGRYLIFHTLTRQVLLLAPTRIDALMPGASLTTEQLSDPLLEELFKEYFLVPEDFDELALYRDVKDILRLKEELPEGIRSYVILPTTACNARCFYCFEQGMRYSNMTEETVQNTIRYILAHAPENRKIHINWFGGEPLMGEKVIDRISAVLQEAGIELHADMISNGSLFTPELIEKAVRDWKLAEVQITLDGLEAEYSRRKRYVSAVKDPFHTVIGNIHQLLSAGIEVKIRLNLDLANVGELFRCVDYLAEEFPEKEEREKLRVYCHSLFGTDCGAEETDADLEPWVDQVNDYIIRSGFPGGGEPLDLALKSTYCMADRAEHAALIDAEGRLFACDAMPEPLRYGDVNHGVTETERYRCLLEERELPAECLRCALLPECTDFRRCPNWEKAPRCREHTENRIFRGLTGLYELSREKADAAKNGEDK